MANVIIKANIPDVKSTLNIFGLFISAFVLVSLVRRCLNVTLIIYISQMWYVK